MNIREEFARAQLRGEIKAQIGKLLLQLPTADRSPVLFDLLAETTGARIPEAAKVDGPAVSEPPSARQIVKLRGGKYPEKTPALMKALAEKPGRPFNELARILYGDDDQKAQAKVRSLINSLYHQGRLNRIAVGKWEVVEATK
jgi:hypothetical protein